jgi:hypothetical protein
MTAQEIAGLTEDERRRLENQSYGDQIEDRMEEFLNKHQDANHQNGNNQISGVCRRQNSEQADAEMNDDIVRREPIDDALEGLIERQNIQQLHQSITQPMFLRNCMTILNSIGHGGINITNALLGHASAQPAGPVSLPIIPAAAPERRNAQ